MRKSLSPTYLAPPPSAAAPNLRSAKSDAFLSLTSPWAYRASVDTPAPLPDMHPTKPADLAKCHCFPIYIAT